MTGEQTGRLASLDLIRGLAVLGILAINIGGFAGPSVATLSPNLPFEGTRADEIAFAVNFLLFEGKMRALFSMLFGASLMLLIERSGPQVQAKRLGWLALFGLAHFYLLWWGDILFLYAAAGMLAILFSEAKPRSLFTIALVLFVVWHAAGAVASAGQVASEGRVLAGTASPGDADEYAQYQVDVQNYGLAETVQVQGSFVEQAYHRIAGQTLHPFIGALESLGETLPLMLLGMAMLQTGFFDGKWPKRRLVLLGVGGVSIGLALTGAILAFAWSRGFAPATMEAAFLYWAAIPHLLMATGYAALLMLAMPRLVASTPGRWLDAAGRMAFSNYIGTSVLMTAIFYGWGLGWIGRFGEAWQWPFVLLGWGAMLVFSRLWLSRFRRGPLEWLWRSLTEQRMLPNRLAA